MYAYYYSKRFVVFIMEHRLHVEEHQKMQQRILIWVVTYGGRDGPEQHEIAIIITKVASPTIRI